MLPILDNDLIRTFVAVCETGTFRAAAERIHRTPSAVSMQMAKLEETLGASLFNRAGRTVTISAKGEELLAYAKRILSLNEEALSRFMGPDLDGLVRVGVPDDYETRLLPKVLARFARQCPDAEIELILAMSQTLVNMVGDNVLDIAIGTSEVLMGAQAPGDLLHAEPMVWMGRSGGMAKLKTPLPLALPGHACVWRQMALQSLDKAALPYRIAFSCEHSHGQLAALLADMAVSALPASYRTPELERIPEDVGLPELGLVVTRIVERPDASPTVRAFARIARETLAQISVPVTAVA